MERIIPYFKICGRCLWGSNIRHRRAYLTHGYGWFSTMSIVSRMGMIKKEDMHTYLINAYYKSSNTVTDTLGTVKCLLWKSSQ